MRKIVLVGLLAAGLTGCAWYENNKESVGQVVDYALELCKFRPKAESVLAMLSAPNPTVVGAFQIALAICAAVAPAQGQGLILTPTPDPEECPKVNGVCIEGTFEEPKPEPTPEEVE